MGGREYVKWDSGGEVPGGICNNFPPFGLFWTYNVAPEGVAVFPERNPIFGTHFAPLEEVFREKISWTC